ncbi:hypothetical protein [Frankia sp. EAN1pec]|uniref:hypothetical protein n=1 Tax=Parafrankia sp. (strain EAN1pec) TaxID=298653 RepID=UPI00059C3DAC
MDRSSRPVSSATNVSPTGVPSWSMPWVQAFFGSVAIASVSMSVQDQPTENSQRRPRFPPPEAMYSSSWWENPAPSRRMSIRWR